MKRVIACLVLLLLQTASFANMRSRPILQVRVSLSEPFPDGSNYLHLRVFGDGRVESEDRRDAETKFVLRKYTLAPDELTLLKEFLNKRAVLELPTAYPPAFPDIDYRTTITISIHRGEKSQTIRITNFNLMLGKDKGLYSQTLLDLMCRIEHIRGNSSFQATSTGWCTLGSRS